MRFFSAIAAAGLAGKARACLTVHAFLAANAYAPDTVTIQLWDKVEGVGDDYEIFVKNAETEFFSDSEDQWCVNDETYRVCVRQNTKQGDVSNTFVDYHSPLSLINTDFNSYCCLQTDGGCSLNCGQYESCLNDNFGCGSCELCDFKSYCNGPRKMFRRELPQSPRGAEPSRQRKRDLVARKEALEAASLEMQAAYVAEHGEGSLEKLIQHYRDNPTPGIEVVN